MIKEEILRNKIDTCCMHETEIKDDYPIDLLAFPGYQIEEDTNDSSPVVICIADGIKDIKNSNRMNRRKQ
jgi:hypothetical protein